MAPFFQKRLSCFYCGLRSTQSQKGPIRQWECKECDAVNYLDENGEITDPPTFETSSSGTRFAQPLLPPGASDSHPDAKLFCSTCIKNQHLLTESLASYLPPQSDPDYAAYEASYPTYRKNLEERYPQVCAICEPRARDRIRQAGYAAKSDHLRRMMEQSRSGRLKARSWNWRSLLVSTGALGYWGSILGQIGWNTAGAMTRTDSAWDVDQELPASAVNLCVDQALAQKQVDGYCSAALTPYAGLALVLGVLTLWWNPRLRHRVEGRGGRLVGLDEYYKIQIFVLVMRFVAWAWLQDPSTSGVDPGIFPAIHIFSVVFTILSVIVSRRAVQFNTTPLVSWQESQEPLLPQAPSAQTGPVRQLESPPDSQTPTGFQAFPINNLAPRQTPTPAHGPYNPPTPPPEIIDDSDAMDWTPSQFSLQPNHSITRLVRQPSVPEPSPFHGQLPAAPNPPSWQLRNARTRRGSTPQAATPKPPHPFPGNLNANQDGQQSEAASEMAFAPPRFFPPSDFDRDTGLEKLFDNAFSIGDEPSDVQKTRWEMMIDQGSRPLAHTNPSTRSHILKCVLLSSSLVAWYLAEMRSIPGKHVEIISLGIACLVAGFSLLETLKKPTAHWSVLDITFSLVQLVASVYLGGSIPRGVNEGRFFDKAGECLLSFMAAQEVMTLVWPRDSSSEASATSLESAPHGSPRPQTRDGHEVQNINAPYSDSKTTTYTATPNRNVQHSPSPSPVFSPTASTHSSSIASPFPSRNANYQPADIMTPLPSQRFAPPAATAAARAAYSPVPSFIGFSLNDNNDTPLPGATRPGLRRYPLRGRRG